MSAITTHILDVSSGVPARGVPVALEQETLAGWKIIGKGVTDEDGRLRDLLTSEADLQAGNYRLTFDTGNYFAQQQIEGAMRRKIAAKKTRVHDNAVNDAR